MDFAKRAYDHSYRIDPVIRSLLDLDFYKLLMMQFIYFKYPNTQVVFAVTNRTKKVKLAAEIGVNELRAQLDHVRTLRFDTSELVWLRGQSFYGVEGIFKPAFLDYLRTFSMPDYTLDYESAIGEGNIDISGQYTLEFNGSWVENTLWELYSLSIMNELRTRGKLAKMSRSDLDITYARAKVKLYDKLVRLAGVEGLSLTDFGTRRRHSHLWQEHCILTAREVLGDKFTGTSNVYFAKKHGLEPRGTNAHELPMVLAALAENDEELRASQYLVLQQWQNVYHVPALHIALPDTFGTTQFLKGAPEWLRLWTGARPDSKKPIPAGEELIAYWKKVAPTNIEDKLIIFSDGMDVRIDGYEPHGEDIIEVHEAFTGRVRVGFGWGTMLTNDFIGCHPRDPDALKAISLVCKVKSAEGRAAIKLSDNYTKATKGAPEELARYRDVFGTEGVEDIPVEV